LKKLTLPMALHRCCKTNNNINFQSKCHSKTKENVSVQSQTNSYYWWQITFWNYYINSTGITSECNYSQIRGHS
jgi:hypothetical protein